MDNETLSTAKKNSLTKLKELLDQGIKVNTKDIIGRTLLHHAVNNKEQDVVKCLLENGADLLITDNKSNTALHIAVTNNDNAMVNVILENISRNKLTKLLDVQTKSTKTAAIHLAAKSNSHANVKTLLDYGANFEIKNNDGKKPVDLANRETLRNLFRLINASFAKAKNGVEQLTMDFAHYVSNTDDFTSVLSCRNNDGHTIIQVLILHEHYELVTNLIAIRCSQPTGGFILFDDPNRKKEVERLATIVRDFRSFWSGKCDNITATMAKVHHQEDVQFKIVTDHAGKIACEALEKAHEVFLAYRKFEGKKKTLTANPAMKSLEEVLEILGFDPEQIYVIAGEDSCYYKKIPSKFTEYIGWLINLMNCIVDASIFYFQRRLSKVQIFDAVKANDMDKVQYLLKNGGSLTGIDRRMRTALTYAIENGNKKMIRFLLKSGAEVACQNAISPIFLAIDMGNIKVLKSLLDNVKPTDMAKFIDLPHKFEGTSLHKAAAKGRLDLVKILLRYGATYCPYGVFEMSKLTPLDVSTNEEVSTFLKIVDECFHDVKEADVELIHKLKAMDNDEFTAIAATKNREGHTLAVVATKSNAKSIAVIILRMIKEAKQEEK